jgi:hypothetical protein
MGLEIPHIQMTGSAIEEKNDAGVRLRSDPDRFTPRLRFQQARERDPEQSQTADLKQMPAANSTVVTIHHIAHQPLRSYVLPVAQFARARNMFAVCRSDGNTARQ